MSSKPTDVKPTRSYDATRRREQARRTRLRILDSAQHHFLARGYAIVTVAEIAADAAVSPDLIYKSFGGKSGLVHALRERALAGEGPRPAEERSDDIQAHERDPHAIIRAWGCLVAEVAPRVAPILLLIRDAAAADPDVRALHDELDADRLRRMTVNARRLHRAGHLRNGITAAAAAEVLWTYSAPELYDLLVSRRGWTPARYGKFVADAMTSALL